VLYISLHEDPTEFPGTGFVNQVGEAAGFGFNLNVPLPPSTGDHVYLKAMEEIVIPVVYQYKPEFILVSAGFDAHHSDFVGSLSLSGACFKRIHRMISSLAARVPCERVTQVLEGGYDPQFVGKNVSLAIAEMSRRQYVFHDHVPTESPQVRILGERVIEEAKRIQRKFWSLE